RLGTCAHAEVNPEGDTDEDHRKVIQKLFTVIGPRFADRPGGYTRVIKRHERRLGDGGRTALLELLKEGETKGRAPPRPPTAAPRPTPTPRPPPHPPPRGGPLRPSPVWTLPPPRRRPPRIPRTPERLERMSRAHEPACSWAFFWPCPPSFIQSSLTR